MLRAGREIKEVGAAHHSAFVLANDDLLRPLALVLYLSSLG
jgi:hypothetical protein